MSMEITPDTSSAKRARTQPKPATEAPGETAAVAKKPRAPRKTLTTKGVAVTPAADTSDELVHEDVGSMIATAAYYLAAARNFTPGHELEDWLEAERAIHSKLYG
jgi:hypothetical protein